MITDGRLGHLNQLRGLAARLQSKTGVELHWFDLAATKFAFTGREGLKRQFGSEQAPDWILAAGNKTHIPLLWCKWVMGGKAMVLMRPSLPLRLFDAVCMPFHDSPPKRRTVLGTYGVINHIVPQDGQRHQGRGLILIGGVNTHFRWNNETILGQVKRIASAMPECEWVVSDSPRTPVGLLNEVAGLGLENLSVLPYSDTGKGWLPKILAEVSQVWVSCDSVSMVYESVSSGAPTGLLELEPSRESRVTKSMAQLTESGLATRFTDADLSSPLSPAARALWEADRAADWWLQIDSEMQ